MKEKFLCRSQKSLRIFMFLVAVVVTLIIQSGVVFASETNRYDVTMDVKEDNSFQITETISMDFETEGHGIYRYIPSLGKIVRQEQGETIEIPYKVRISNINVANYEYSISRENDNVVIRIGSEDTYLSGPQTFHITYTVQVYDDGYREGDWLYWNLIGNGWTEPILESTFVINMPKEFDASQAEFIAGAYAGTDMEAVQWDVSGRTLTAHAVRKLYAGESVTVNIPLPEGYFTGMLSTTPWKIGLLLVLMIMPLIALCLWWFFGREAKPVQTVEFYPPEGSNPAEVGYIIDGFVDNKDVVSLIVHLAEKGYLSIESKGKKDVILKKEKPLPATAKPYEITMFYGLFTSGKDEVNIADLKEEFYSTFTRVQKQVKAEFTQDAERKLFQKSALIARVFAFFPLSISFVVMLLAAILISFETGVFVVILGVSFVFLVGSCILLLIAHDKRHSLSKSKYIVLITCGLILFFVFTISVMIYSSVALRTIWLGLAYVLGSAVCVFCISSMQKHTPRGNELLGKLLGLKHFIKTAELDRIKRLCDENPEYFYHILPYAYVFGLTNQWIKQFEHITIPEPSWYGGYHGTFNAYLFMNSFNQCTNALQNNLAAVPDTSSGGGGFSSGGGFSGGGMGGGGGGRW